jgi:sugar/nucleoside kinase (ribokinase family)
MSVVAGGSTGTSLILITPDAERTMNTCLGCAGDFNADILDGDVIASSNWLLLEGYLFANPHGGEGGIRASIEHAVKGNTKIALTCSDTWVVSAFFDKIKDIIPKLNLLVANESEALELAKRWVEANPHHFTGVIIEGVEDAMGVLRRLVPECVITLGAKGAFLAHKDHVEHVAAYPCTPVDLTGAGDAFIGTYINARNDGHSLAVSGSLACFVASKVVTQIGPRLQDPSWLLNEWKQDQKTPLHTANLRS